MWICGDMIMLVCEYYIQKSKTFQVSDNLVKNGSVWWDTDSCGQRKSPRRIGGNFFLMVPKAGIEPARLAPSVFETDVSTNSTTSAWFDDYSEQDLFVKGLYAGKCVCKFLPSILHG